MELKIGGKITLSENRKYYIKRASCFTNVLQITRFSYLKTNQFVPKFDIFKRNI